MTTERSYTPAEVAALLDATSGDQEPAALEPFEMCEECGAELDSGSECIDGAWLCVNCWPEAAKEAADVVAVDAYEESVQDRLSDLRNDGVFWAYGDLPACGGWCVWLATYGPRDWETNTSEQRDDLATYELVDGGEAAARAEATRRNRGEG